MKVCAKFVGQGQQGRVWKGRKDRMANPVRLLASLLLLDVLVTYNIKKLLLSLWYQHELKDFWRSGSKPGIASADSFTGCRVMSLHCGSTVYTVSVRITASTHGGRDHILWVTGDWNQTIKTWQNATWLFQSLFDLIVLSTYSLLSVKMLSMLSASLLFWAFTWRATQK